MTTTNNKQNNNRQLLKKRVGSFTKNSKMSNQNDKNQIINSKPQEETSSNNGTFPYGESVKPELQNKTTLKHQVNSLSNLNSNDIARNIIFKFGSLKNFSQRMLWSKGRLVQILRGYKVPQDPAILRKMADLLGFDVVILTQVLNRPQEDRK